MAKAGDPKDDKKTDETPAEAPLGREPVPASDLAFLVGCFVVAAGVTFGTLFWGNRTGFLLVPATYIALGALVIKRGV